MPNFPVKYTFNDGSGDVILPVATEINDPKEGTKGNLIEGTRGDGSIFIPGGKKSQTISLKGVLSNHLGYSALISDKKTFETNITNNVATLTCKHYESSIWQTDYSWTIIRINPIIFAPSLRTDYIEYTVEFVVLAY